jgi:hypothetical protein
MLVAFGREPVPHRMTPTTIFGVMVGLLGHQEHGYQRCVVTGFPGDPPGWSGRILLPEAFLGALVVRRSRR